MLLLLVIVTNFKVGTKLDGATNRGNLMEEGLKQSGLANPVWANDTETVGLADGKRKGPRKDLVIVANL